MAQAQIPGSVEPLVSAPDVTHLVTEDGAPVDSIFSEKQMRLLTAPLYASWQAPGGRPFFAAANVGVFAVAKNPALVPAAFLSTDVEPPLLTGPDRVRSYFVWEFGKPPDVVIEVVSDTAGAELSDKLRGYERMRVAYYVVFDPLHVLGETELHVFGLDGAALVERSSRWFERVGIGLCQWEGEFEGIRARWLRYCDASGVPIPTGSERADDEQKRADAEQKRADTEQKRADTEQKRAEEERKRADRLAERLRALGLDPDAKE
jgi:hypothetical protein